MRCRTWNPIDEWTGSLVRIPGAGTGIPSTVLVASSTIMGALLSGGEGLWRLVANVWWRRNSLHRGGAAPRGLPRALRPDEFTSRSHWRGSNHRSPHYGPVPHTR